MSTSTHVLCAELLRMRGRVLDDDERAFVESVHMTLRPSVSQHDLVCVLHTRAEVTKPTRETSEAFRLLADDFGIQVGSGPVGPREAPRPARGGR